MDNHEWVGNLGSMICRKCGMEHFMGAYYDFPDNAPAVKYDDMEPPPPCDSTRVARWIAEAEARVARLRELESRPTGAG